MWHHHTCKHTLLAIYNRSLFASITYIQIHLVTRLTQCTYFELSNSGSVMAFGTVAFRDQNGPWVTPNCTRHRAWVGKEIKDTSIGGILYLRVYILYSGILYLRDWSNPHILGAALIYVDKFPRDHYTKQGIIGGRGAWAMPFSPACLDMPVLDK